MTNIHKLEATVIGMLLFLACAMTVACMHFRHRMAIAEAVAQERQQQIAQREQNIRARDTAAVTYTRHLSAEADTLKTAPQAAAVLTRYLKAAAPAGSPASIQLSVVPITVEPQQLSTTLQAELPASPNYTVFTEAQTIQIGKDELACDAARHSLSACLADTADLRASLADETAVAATWKAAAKGGSKWARLGRVAKYAACAAAPAATAALFKSTPGTTAAASAGGVIACSLF